MLLFCQFVTANIVKIPLNTSSYIDKYCKNKVLFTIFSHERNTTYTNSYYLCN